jgi:hypothetical protein
MYVSVTGLALPLEGFFAGAEMTQQGRRLRKEI